MQRSMEEILEAAWKAEEQGDLSPAVIDRICPIHVGDEELALLEREGLLVKDGEQLRFTREGRYAARSVVRRHRLAETLFATILHLDADKREQLACEVEHTLLPEVEEAICILLGHPSLCPDNKPIPEGTCCSARRRTTGSLVAALTSLKEGESGRIAFVKPKSHDRLERLTSFGLTPGTMVRVFQRTPALCIEFEGTELALNRDAAEDIFVTRVS